MKSAWKRSVAGFFLWSALAGLAAAQADEICKWEAWKGTPAPWKNAAEAERTVAEYRAWLAELRVKLMTGRAAELTDWEERLELIRLHATSALGLPAQRELLVEVTRARAQALSALGRYDEARAAAQAVLLAPGDPAAAAQKGQRVTAPPALLALAESALADPALEEVRSDLSPTAPADSAQDEGLDERLRKAIKAGDFELVSQVGARAAPALEEAIALDLARLPADPITDDAFYLLADISERRAAGFALAHIDAGYAFRLRVVHTMQRREVFGGKPPSTGAMMLEEPRAPSPFAAQWSLVVAELLRHGDSAGNALQLVEAMIRADLLSAEVTSALAAALRGPGKEELSADLLQHLSSVPSAKTALGLFELLVGHEDPCCAVWRPSACSRSATSQRSWSEPRIPIRRCAASSCAPSAARKTFHPRPTTRPWPLYGSCSRIRPWMCEGQPHPLWPSCPSRSSPTCTGPSRATPTPA